MLSLLGQVEAQAWSSNQVISLGLWIGFIVFACVLLVVWRSRWGQVKPLSKCVALSVLAHLLLLAIAYTTRLPADLGQGGQEEIASLRMLDWSDVEDLDWETSPEPQPRPDPLEPQPIPEQSQIAPWEQSGDVDAPIAEEFPAVEANPTVALDRSIDPGFEPGADPTSPAPIPTQQLTVEPATSPVIDRSAVRATAQGFDPQTYVAAASPFAESFLDSSTAPPPMNPELPAGAAGGVDARSAEVDALWQAGVETLIAGAPPVPIANRISAPQPTLIDIPRPELVPQPQRTAMSEQQMQQWLALPAARRLGDGAEVPSLYRMRPAMRSARRLPKGTTIDSEAAVEQALLWLVRNQESDGRWDASRHGAGREEEVLGENRGGAGGQADTGITGLAILALLGHGHTHLEGEHRESVQRGLEFLLASQGADGELYGHAEIFARMYSHSIATIAITEAYAMTGDPRLLPGVEGALRYTRASQHSNSGGWRYRPQESGDMSQFGWQVMALRAGEQSGIAIPESTRLGMQRFLESCASGRSGGRSSYRPREAASPTMTAESLACRYWLGLPLEPARVSEALDTSLAGDATDSVERPNLYYLYYAALALHEHGGSTWDRWNSKLQQRLLASQELSGENAGSWSPETRWGGYGGRVYSTALATLCLEIPYRYVRAQQ